jgi:conjugal transfer pilus assembly protein TraF
MGTSTKFVALLAFGILAAQPCLAHAERLQGYFEQHSDGAETKPRKEGYFFYKDELPLPVMEPKPQEPDETTVAEKKDDEKKEFDGEIPWDELYAMHPDKFQALLDETLKWSLMEPTKERVQKYMTMQYVAMDRAEKFQQVWMDILNVQPALDTTAQRAPTATGTKLAVLEKAVDLKNYIHEMRENMGILMFSRSDCPYCAEQMTILQSFSDWWKWENIQVIDIEENSEVAAHYGVSIVPDLFIVGNVNDEILQKRLNVGITTRDVIEKGLLEAYSLWFEGRRYAGDMVRQGQEAFESYFGELVEERKEKKEKSKESALDRFVEQYQAKKFRKW